MNYYCEVKTDLGPMHVTYSDNAISGLYWPSNLNRATLAKDFILKKDHTLIERLEAQLQEYFMGQRKTFDLPLDPIGTDFQRSAWQALVQIPFGKTISYQEQAEKLGAAQSSRAVGTANSKNPISILIPCHRVIAKSGKISGYAGGIENKKKLLALESGAGAV